MDDTLRRKALEILESRRCLTLATLRPDGWPQATTVGFAHEGLTLYILCGLESQKAHNLARDTRVSVTVDDEDLPLMQITGLSMAARAQRITDPVEGRRVIDLLMSRYTAAEAPPGFTAPPPEVVALFRLTPTVISVLDYTKGFAHTDTIACEAADLAA